MDHDTQEEITRMIDVVQGMAAKYFANDSAHSAFGILVACEEDYGDDSPVIGEGIWRGLRELLKPQNVYVQAAEDGYLITIERG
ncbi:hypothetical protein [Pseudomonas sp. NPDC089406]|uniref:hypothetical protein n=1 Tax=Pseudomonas sp. NPDC089406 TaxID=3364463 RepID=UPI00384FC4B5